MTKIWPIEGIALDADSDSVNNSLGDLVQSLYNANYTEGRVYPTLAAGASIVCWEHWLRSFRHRQSRQTITYRLS